MIFVVSLAPVTKCLAGVGADIKAIHWKLSHVKHNFAAIANYQYMM